jgi:hypothetical protein
MNASFYDSGDWRALSRRAITRDRGRCTVSRLLGGACGGSLHAHHFDPDADPLDIDNVGTTCAVHHPTWEALRRAIVRARARLVVAPCNHVHRYDHARRECRARRARQLGL